ncbi:MAG: BCD family MFS transporter [Chloroflexales bacterium]|nr:BCD family MFS transporter [Chloroflexales bacterium]
MQQQTKRFSLLRTMKIGTFHIGSAFADILTSGVWNRILISDLGIAATPVAFLSALRYLLAPLSIWAGYRSDTRPLFGFHRLPYIWFGRLLMLITLPLLPVVTILLAANPLSVSGWGITALAFVIYGVGTLLSGSTFLALIRDSTPPTRHGQALSIVQVFLVVSFPISALIYGQLMPVYDPLVFWEVVLLGTALAAGFWFFSLAGEERRGVSTIEHDPDPLPFGALLREILQDQRARNFFFFLALGAVSAFAQDAVLEPFGGDVFDMEAGETTRFNLYWGIGVLFGMVTTIVLTRKRPAYAQTDTTSIGLFSTAAPLALLGVISVTRIEALLIPTLILFGLGLGIYTVGAVSLLMAMTSNRRAGAYLGLWSVAQLVFRGVGISLGGALRDGVLLLSDSHAVAYAAVFLLEAIGLLCCVALLRNIDIAGFARREEPAPAATLAALAD